MADPESDSEFQIESSEDIESNSALPWTNELYILSELKVAAAFRT